MGLGQKYKLRVLRKYALWRSFRSRRQLELVRDRTGLLTKSSIVCVMCVRNEALRLPYFLQYYRKLGVDQFLIVDNASTDGTQSLLQAQPDVSVWVTQASYRESRYGVDWTTWLQMKHARGKWCLTLDADEILVYPECETRGLRELTAQLDRTGKKAFGALMLDMYPKGALDQQVYLAGADPMSVLSWFDAGPYRATRQAPKQNLWVQGGARERVFFPHAPHQGPTLNKLPLVKWRAPYAYVNSTHSILPASLNFEYGGPHGDQLSGVLLHTKFLPDSPEKSAEEKERRQHFGAPEDFVAYYDQIISGQTLWSDSSVFFEGWQQLEGLGLMSRGPKE